MPPIDVRTEPGRYRHWRLAFDGPLATLTMDVDPAGGLFEGTELKLNSYDLGVDIELADAVQRLRFEHPEVRCVVLESGKENVFCAGANIRMLGKAPHAHKVNFCKFTNETRLAMEDASACSGQRYLAALGGPAAGGGYELAEACDWIMLIDDRRSAVSLPEVALLGVLPGIAIAVALSILNVFRRAWWPYDTVLGRVEGLEGYHDIHTHPDAWHLPGLVLYRFDAPLFFANATTFRDEVRRLAKAEPKPSWILIAAEPVTDVDTTASDVLTELDEALNARGISLVFAELKGPVRRKIERYGLTRTIDPDHFFPTIAAAVAAFQAETGAQWTPADQPAADGQAHGLTAQG